jgi:hypothetical protein
MWVAMPFPNDLTDCIGGAPVNCIVVFKVAEKITGFLGERKWVDALVDCPWTTLAAAITKKIAKKS